MLGLVYIYCSYLGDMEDEQVVTERAERDSIHLTDRQAILDSQTVVVQYHQDRVGHH